VEAVIVRTSALPLPWMAAIVLLVTAAGTTLAVVLARLVRRDLDTVLPTPPAAFMATLFALFVSFLASSVWEDAARARDAVEAEAAALLDARAYLTLLPEDQANRIGALLRSYVAEVAGREWPAMSHGRDSPEADTMLVELRLAVLALGDTSTRAAAGLQRSADSIARARDQRLSVAHAVVSALKWAAVLCLGFSALFALSLATPGHVYDQLLGLGPACVAITVGLLVVMATDRPFLGQVSVTPQPLLAAAADLPGGRE